VVLFGLSIDYHVLILSRIREDHDRGLSTSEAVAHGLKSTAGVVTSAAIVTVAVFSIFATLSAVAFKQLGVGLAAAVLIDATIVRAVLLPSAMAPAGRLELVHAETPATTTRARPPCHPATNLLMPRSHHVHPA
jgi:RND superfamily putative drug exporter